MSKMTFMSKIGVILKNCNHKIVAKWSGELEIIRTNIEKTDINVEIDTRPTYGKLCKH